MIETRYTPCTTLLLDIVRKILVADGLSRRFNLHAAALFPDQESFVKM